MNAEYAARRRSMALAYVAWLFFGVFGAHRFYLKRYNSASAMLALSVGPYVAAFIVGFIAGLLGWGRGVDDTAVDAVTSLCHMVLAGWMIVDIFLIPGMVESYNLAIAHAIKEGAHG